MFGSNHALFSRQRGVRSFYGIIRQYCIFIFSFLFSFSFLHYALVMHFQLITFSFPFSELYNPQPITTFSQLNCWPTLPTATTTTCKFQPTYAFPRYWLSNLILIHHTNTQQQEFKSNHSVHQKHQHILNSHTILQSFNLFVLFIYQSTHQLKQPTNTSI